MRWTITSLIVFSLASLAAGQDVNIENLDSSWSFQLIKIGEQGGTKKPPVVTSVRIQPNGAHIAIAGDDHIVRIWDMAADKFVYQLDGHRDWVRSIAYSPDGKILATAGNDRRIILWNAATGEKMRVLAVHHEAIANLEYSHNGQMLATTGFENQLHLYNAESGEILFELACPCRDMRALAFSPNDQTLAAGGRNGTIRLYQCNTGQPIRDLAAHRQRIRELTFTSAGDQIISCGEDRLVRVSSVIGDASHVLPRRPAKLLSMSLYAPGRLATAGTDNVIRLWNLDTRQEIGQLTGHTGSVATLVTDRNVLVSGGFDTTVRIWTIRRNVAEQPAQPPTRVGAANRNDFE